MHKARKSDCSACMGLGPNAGDRIARSGVCSGGSYSSGARRALFARGIVTAIGWIVDAPRAFSPDKIEEAMRYLGIPMNHYEPIKTMVGTLQQELKKQKAQTA